MKTFNKNVPLILCVVGAILCIASLCILGISTKNINESKHIEEEVQIDEVEKYETAWNVSYDLTKLSKYLVPDETLEERFYLDNIPSEFADAFLYYSRNRKEMRPYFYAIMKHESNFKVYWHKNADGSIDKGPSHLNTKNINSKTFRDWYNPKDESHITSVYCFYMVMSMNFYWDLVNKYGYDYAYYAYNGGEKTVKLIKNRSSQNASLIKAVKNYDYKVRLQLSEAQSNITSYIAEKRAENINELYAFLHDNYNKSYNVGKNAFIVKLENNLQNGNKFTNNDVFYIRREDLLQFEIKEGTVVGQTIIGTLNI